MNKLLPIVILFLLIQPTRSAWSQSYPLKWYSTSDGLPHSTIRGIVQDKAGYIWLGTHNGVARFDGTEFRAFNAPSKEMMNRLIISVVPDFDSTGVFCATEYGNVFHIDSYGNATKLARFVNGRLDFPSNVTRIARDTEKRLWIATDEGALLSLDQRGTWKEFHKGNGCDLGNCRRPTWYQPLKEVWVKRDMRTIARLTPQGEVRAFDVSRMIPEAKSDPSFNILSITPNKATGGIWLTTTAGLLCIDGKDRKCKFFPQKNVEGYVYFTSCTDAEGNLWFVQSDDKTPTYAYRKISYIDGSILLSIERDDAFLQMLPFGAIFEDHEGSIWIGADGLAQVGSTTMLNYQIHTAGFPAATRNFVHASTGEKYVQTWMGPFKISDARYEPPKYIDTRKGEKPTTSSSTLLETPDGMLHWFELPPQSFILKDGKPVRDLLEMKFTYRGKRFSVTEALVTLRDGVILFPEYENGNHLYLVKPNGDSTSLYLPFADRSESASSETILATRRFRQGAAAAFIFSQRTLWEVHSDRRFVSYGKKDGYLGGVLPAACDDSSGNVWIGFRRPADEATLTRFDGKTFHHYTSDEIKLPNPAIESICAHPNKRDLLILTSDRLCYFDLHTKRVRKILTQRDGLFPLSFRVTVDRDGIIWICGVAGITRIDEAQEREKTPTPQVVITKFNAGEKPLLLPSHIATVELNERPERIDVTYSALSYRYRPILYRTKLDGYNADWSAPTQETFARFMNLDAGTYTFRVKALHPEGMWESAETSFTFSVPPPFYRTWWFILGANVLALVIIFGIIRYRLAQALKMERMRSQIALDLHDEISSTLTSISFLSTAVVRELKESNPTTAQKARKIGETARSVIEIMSDIIWSLKPTSDTFADLGKRLGDMATEMCEGASINLHLNVPSTAAHIPLRMDRRRQLYLIAKEAIHNALKHSQCTQLWITFRPMKKTFELIIEDNGRGIDHAREHPSNGTHSGLASMKKRAQECGAELFIEPRDEGGTRVRVVVKELG